MSDIAEMLKTLQRQKPPMDCPVCGKEYRSFSGISYHIVKFHSNGQINNSTPFNVSFSDSFNTPEYLRKQPLSYADAQRMVEFDIKGSLIRNLINEPLSIEVESEQSEGEETAVPEVKTSPVKPSNRGTPRKRGRGRARLVHYKQRSYVEMRRNLKLQEEKKPALPVAVFSTIPEEDILERDVPQRKSYFRYIDKTSDELDEEVEYGMDEEDYIWLEELNEARNGGALAPVSHEIFEMLMDRLEKESHFETRTVTGDPYNMIDEDAVCSICCDGECSNSNVILFCDMCNLAVHQECYGVPYIPEGQWLCRKCLQSPSKPVSCVLCPTKSGAFKQTDASRWAHVVCALWIPEVCFANTVFLEPIDSIGNIPTARWKLVCYICKKKSGACIQCFKTNCYTAFHVTCAQQGGLHMKIEAGRLENGQPTVKKSAYCDVHMPKDAAPGFGTPCSDYCSDEDSDTSVQSKASVNSKMSSSSAIKKSAAYQTPSAKLKEVQKKLLEKLSFKMPAVHIPFVPAHRLTKIVSKVALAKKSQFIQQLQSYWMLKRQSRNGVPLLRRLQVNTGTGINRNHKEQTLEEWSQSKELKEQLRYWQQLRHDLERVRLLIELIRKREKIKKEQYRMKQQLIDLQLKPQHLEMERTLMLLQERDTSGIFAEPVKAEEAPDYHEFITEPMDFSTMRQKLADYEYMNLDQFEADFNLMIQNCMKFNHEDTLYYRAAVRMRTQCKPILKAALKRIRQACIDPQTGIHAELPQASNNTDEMATEEDVSTLVDNPFMTIDEKIEDLEIKLELAGSNKSALVRFARQKMLRKEISKLKRQKRKSENPFNTSSNTENDPNETGANPDSAPSGLHKRGRKRGRPTNEAYNGEVKLPSQEADVESEGEDQVRESSPDKNGESVPDNIGNVGTLTFSSPDKVVRNPSPGRSRRSGILFKKKQYQPVTPSPLVLYSSTTTATSEDDHEHRNPLKLRLRIENPSSVQTENNKKQVQYLRTRSHDSAIVNNTKDTSFMNGEDSETLTRRRLSTQSHKRETRDREVSEPRVNGVSKLSNDLPEGDDDCFENERDTSDGQSTSPRKRTYTNSSANSDTDGPPNAISQRRRSHKRGRQKRPKLSFRQEFADLEGINDIKYGVYMVNEREADLLDPKCEPKVLDFLSLIWAKCKGYPSYPALTIDPSMPRSGFQSNGVPIPIPPVDVLEMNDEPDRYLILFFDAKRTWQWLPRDKIEPLGVDSRLDEVKLVESKKPSMRKNVHEAYKRAIAFRRRLEIGENSDEDSPDSPPLMNGDANGYEQYEDPSPNENTYPFFPPDKESQCFGQISVAESTVCQ